MEEKQSRLFANEVSDGEVTMMAAQDLLGNLFEVADNDSQYHRTVNSVQDDIVHGQCSCDAEEIAESILAWSGAIK